MFCIYIRKLLSFSFKNIFLIEPQCNIIIESITRHTSCCTFQLHILHRKLLNLQSWCFLMNIVYSLHDSISHLKIFEVSKVSFDILEILLCSLIQFIKRFCGNVWSELLHHWNLCNGCNRLHLHAFFLKIFHELPQHSLSLDSCFIWSCCTLWFVRYDLLKILKVCETGSVSWNTIRYSLDCRFDKLISEYFHPE